jgi:non-specific serine/threonine protein kinase
MNQTLDQPPHNLPLALSSFIGREREMAEVQHLLASHRLFTLTGPGGCGKTRLALQVANELAADFADGLWLVELAPLAEADLVPQAVASACSVRELPVLALIDVLVEHFLPRTAVLLLDNCEHLITACAFLAEHLLRTCPQLRILATSREPLNVPGEVCWPVPPLSLPEPQPWRSPSSGQDALPIYQQAEAVRLFAERAAAAYPDFVLTAENGPWVAEICRRLDGMPLAIELAAARVRTLAVSQIAARLDNRFGLLTGGSRTAPPRQQTLLATLDWSYALLADHERQVLQRLSVFAGGCSLEAAEAVCSRNGLEQAEVLECLANLVDKSLVSVESLEDQRRFRLLETIRQYAAEKLAASGGVQEAHSRHLDFFVQWAEKAKSQLVTDQLTWLSRFEVEHDNLRAALEWSLGPDEDVGQGLRLAAACGRFWRLRAYLSEGRRRLAAVLALAEELEPTASHYQALFWEALFAYLQSDYPASRARCQASLERAHALGPAGRYGVAEALALLGEIATEEGDYTTAPQRFTEALVLWRELGDVRGIGDTLMQMGWAMMRLGDYEQAISQLEESLALFREANFTADIALNLAGLGEAAVRQGDYKRASQLLQESLTLRRKIGDKWGIGTALGSLGWLALQQGNFRQMRQLLGESIAIRQAIRDRSGIAWCLEKLAQALIVQLESATERGRVVGYQRAAWLLGAAASLRAPFGSVIDPADQPQHERDRAQLQTALGAESFAAAWASGANLPLAQIVAEALVEPAVQVAAKPEVRGLTPREWETAVLIAQGKSNREIAEIMTVREKTIETYVTRILNKMSFESRVQVAVWVVEQNPEPSPPNF